MSDTNEMHEMGMPLLRNKQEIMTNTIHEQNVENNDSASEGRTIMEISKSHYWLRVFLIATANYWPVTNGNFEVLCKVHFVFTRIIILLCAIQTAALFIESMSGTYHALTDIGYSLSFFVLLLASISVLPAQYFNRQRVHALLIKEELEALDSCLTSAYTFAAAAVAVSTLAIVMNAIYIGLIRYGVSYVFLHGHSFAFFSQFFVALVLAFNMFILMLDVHTSTTMLNHLHVLAEQRALTIEKFAWTRGEIHKRVAALKLATDFIIVPCLTSAAGIVMAILLMKKFSSVTTEEIYQSGFILTLLKEIIYLFVAFWYVAQVNERADELTVKTSLGLWGKYSSTDVESVQTPDLHRLSVHASGVSQPITFRLLFTRVSKRGFLLSAAGFSVSILVGIIKNIAGL